MHLELPPEAQALLDAVLAIGSDLDLKGVLSRIVEASCSLTEAEYGVLALVDDDGSFVDFVTSERAAVAFAGVPAPVGRGLLGVVPRERRAVRAAPPEEHPGYEGHQPAGHPEIDSFLGSPVLVGGQAFGHLYLGNKRGGAPFTPTDQALVEALAGAAGVMIENARAYEQVEWRRQWLAGASRIGGDFTGSVQLEEALDELVCSVRTLCTASLVAYVRHDGDLLEIRQSAGDADAPRVVDELTDRIREVVDTGTAQRIPVGAGVVTFVVPVRTRLAGGGVLLIANAREGAALRGAMLDLVSLTADQVGLLLDRDQALRDRAQLLVARDRDRIARDLHDLVIQRLFATGMQLQAGRALDSDALRGRVDVAVTELDLAIKELRGAIFELSSTRGKPLVDQVRSLISEYAGILGFQPVLRVVGAVDRALTPAAAEQALTSLREILSNVVRHAAAHAATVEVKASSAWFRLRVTDDGVGYDASSVSLGNGSANLYSRADELGGHYAVTSAAGLGTSVEWVIPAVG